jgi:hypothetical protein
MPCAHKCTPPSTIAITISSIATTNDHILLTIWRNWISPEEKPPPTSPRNVAHCGNRHHPTTALTRSDVFTIPK